MKRVTILGATGSIGQSTLSVVEQNPEAFRVFALTAHTSIDILFDQCRQFSPQYAVVSNPSCATELQQRLNECGTATEVLVGEQALCDVAADQCVDIVMAAIVGAAGLVPTLAAVRAGKQVLLANKESLVMSGRLFIEQVKKFGAELLPIDSEHNAIFQCLPADYKNLSDAGIRKILLTGSGGPFRETHISELENVTPAQACAHPNWSMGRKISVDSATMMNKGLEFIEACWLFGAKPSDIEVVVHPQSIVHSMVQYQDGSVLAQMGNPDMRTPIAHCMAFPDRINAGVKPLDFAEMVDLSFEAPDFQRFPCLQLAINAAEAGGDYAVALNAGNEVVVDLFLQERIKFTQIAQTIEKLMEKWDSSEPDDIGAVIDADKRARERTLSIVKSLG